MTWRAPCATRGLIPMESADGGRATSIGGAGMAVPSEAFATDWN